MCKTCTQHTTPQCNEVRPLQDVQAKKKQYKIANVGKKRLQYGILSRNLVPILLGTSVNRCTCGSRAKPARRGNTPYDFTYPCLSNFVFSPCGLSLLPQNSGAKQSRRCSKRPPERQIKGALPTRRGGETQGKARGARESETSNAQDRKPVRLHLATFVCGMSQG